MAMTFYGNPPCLHCAGHHGFGIVCPLAPTDQQKDRLTGERVVDLKEEANGKAVRLALSVLMDAAGLSIVAFREGRRGSPFNYEKYKVVQSRRASDTSPSGEGKDLSISPPPFLKA